MRVRQRQAERDRKGDALRNGQTSKQSIYLKTERKMKKRAMESKKGGIKCCCTWKAAATSARP